MKRVKPVTLRTLADDLGLTVHTVSKALRGLPGMSEQTRRAVAGKAREFGYLTKDQESGIYAERIPWAIAKPRRFALLIGGDQPYQRQQAEGARLRLSELGHALFPLAIPDAVISEPKRMEEWQDRVGLRYTDGVLLAAAIPEPVEAVLLGLPLPKVLINYPPERAEVDSVVWDVEHAVHLTMEALRTNGHRDVLYVGDIGPARGFRRRWEAFVSAERREGRAEADPEEHVTNVAASGSRWTEKLKERLRSGRYTAVLSAIPGQAEVLCAAAASVGLAIPADLSLAGMEHEEPADLPGLSRPELIAREAGERAAELLARRIANPTLPFEHVLLKGRFLAGGTIRAIGEALNENRSPRN